MGTLKVGWVRNVAIAGMMVLGLGIVGSGGDTLAASAPTTAPDKASTDTDPWKALYEAAKAEGVVNFAGHPSEARRSAYMKFQEAYPEIKVNYVALGGSEADERLRSEWRAGVFDWDVITRGQAWLIAAYHNEPDLLADLHEWLLPEVMDDSKWFNGFNANFNDVAKKYVFAFHIFIAETVFVKDDLAPADSFTSLSDLLDPKYKGKICWVDPRVSRTTETMTAFVMMRLGEEGIRTLLSDQEPQIFGSEADLVSEMVRTNNCYIGVGVTRPALEPYVAEGLADKIVRIEPPDGRFYGGSNTISVPKKPPHPNAAKLFLNWWLSAAGQTAWAEQGAENSRRLDVPLGNPERMPDLAKTGWFQYDPEDVDFRNKFQLPARALVAEILAAR